MFEFVNLNIVDNKIYKRSYNYYFHYENNRFKIDTVSAFDIEEKINNIIKQKNDKELNIKINSYINQFSPLKFSVFSNQRSDHEDVLFSNVNEIYKILDEYVTHHIYKINNYNPNMYSEILDVFIKNNIYTDFPTITHDHSYHCLILQKNIDTKIKIYLAMRYSLVAEDMSKYIL